MVEGSDRRVRAVMAGLFRVQRLAELERLIAQHFPVTPYSRVVRAAWSLMVLHCDVGRYDDTKVARLLVRAGCL